VWRLYFYVKLREQALYCWVPGQDGFDEPLAATTKHCIEITKTIITRCDFELGIHRNVSVARALPWTRLQGGRGAYSSHVDPVLINVAVKGGVESFFGVVRLWVCMISHRDVLHVIGTDRFYYDMSMMLGYKPCRWWAICWRFITPALIAVFIITLLLVL